MWCWWWGVDNVDKVKRKKNKGMKNRCLWKIWRWWISIPSNMEKPLKRGCKQWIVSKVHDLSLYTTVYTGFPLPVPYDFHRLCTGLSTGFLYPWVGDGKGSVRSEWEVFGVIMWSCGFFIILSHGWSRMSTDAMEDNIITRMITDVHGRHGG